MGMTAKLGGDKMGRSTEGYGGTSVNTDPLAQSREDIVLARLLEMVMVDGIPTPRGVMYGEMPDIDLYYSNMEAAKKMLKEYKEMI